MAYPDLVIARAPLGYWRLTEASGASADQSGHGHPMTLAGGAALAQPGPFPSHETCAAFAAASSSYASASLDLSTHPIITIEFWMLWSAWANNDQIVLEYTPNQNSNNGLLINPNSSNSGGKFASGLSKQPGGNYWDDLVARPSAGSWHHYAIVLDRTTPQVQTYIDGVLASTGAFGSHDAGVIGTAFAGPSTLYVMSRAGGSLFGDGKLQELAVYDRALTPAEIAADYAEAFRTGMAYRQLVLADRPAGYWPLDEASGSAADESGNGHTGAVSGVTQGAAALVSAAAASFAGASTIQVPSAVGFDSGGALTAEAWIKTADASLASILDRDSQTGTRLWQFRLYLRVVNWLLFFPGGPVALAGNKVLDDNIWHHIVGTYDGAHMRIYVDGVLDAEAAQTGSVNTGSVPIWMGNAQYGSGQSYTGEIDEAAVYTTALSAARIAAHYRQGVRRGVTY